MVFRKIVFLLITSAFSAGAADNTGLAFLKIGVGARATALGGAYTALADDASGQFWNPAGSAWAKRRALHFTHNSWIQGINHEAASILFPAFKGTLGIGLVLNSVSNIERRTIASEEPLGTFSAHDFAMSLTYARMFGQKLSWGITGKFLNEKIYYENASGYAFDAGVRYLTGLPGLFVAGAIQNLGSINELANQSITLPRTMRIGLAYQTPLKILNSTLLLAADYVKLAKEEGNAFLGIEWQSMNVLSLRGGYQSGLDERDLSAGFGLSVGSFFIDYAYIPFSSNLGSSRRFSILAVF